MSFSQDKDTIYGLMVKILFSPDISYLLNPLPIISKKTLFDPIMGSGRCLAEALKFWQKAEIAPELEVFGQELESELLTTASNVLSKEALLTPLQLQAGNSLIFDKFKDKRFDYFIASVKNEELKWPKKVQSTRSLELLAHMVSKFKPVDIMNNGSRLVVLLPESSLKTGDVGSIENYIRKEIIQADLVETIIALPGKKDIGFPKATCLMVITNRKKPSQKGKIRIIDARNYESDNTQEDLATRIYNEYCREEGLNNFSNNSFGYIKAMVERPLRLKFQLSLERKAVFSNIPGCPHLFDDVQAIQLVTGRDAWLDWNKVRELIDLVFKERNSKWSQSEFEFFRSVFTEHNPEATPVLLPNKQNPSDNFNKFEPDPNLSFFVKISLGYFDFLVSNSDQAKPDAEIGKKDLVEMFFKNEIQPSIPDAWLDRSQDELGYEIDLNKVKKRFLGEIVPTTRRHRQKYLISNS